jgi:RNA polymerase sigma-70 factor (ECF subfamily)
MALRPAELTDQIPGLLRYALLLTRDETAAADLVQETLLRALERGSGFRGEASPGTWLRRVLHHRFVDQVRADREVPMGGDDLDRAVEAAWQADAYTVDGEAVVRRAEVVEELADALIRLPAEVRSAVLLHDVEGLTSAEVARVQDVGVPAAKARIRRGRAALVSLLADGPPPLPPHRDGVPLRCWDARSRVEDYLDDELDSQERSRLERHLAGCPTCPELYAALVGVRAGLHGVSSRSGRDPESVVPAALADRVRQVLQARGESAESEASRPVRSR